MSLSPNQPIGADGSAPDQPMQGLPAFLRAQASSLLPETEAHKCLRDWAREVEAAQASTTAGQVPVSDKLVLLALNEYNREAAERLGDYYHVSVSRMRNAVEAVLLAAAPQHSVQVASVRPINMVLFCPACGKQHIDRPDPLVVEMMASRWTNPPHKTHLCRTDDGGCGHIWRPASVATNGVESVPAGERDSPISKSPAASSLGCSYQGKHFGADYEDATCIDGYLWDLDSCDEPGGALQNGGEIPCPSCNADAFREYYKELAEGVKPATASRDEQDAARYRWLRDSGRVFPRDGDDDQGWGPAHGSDVDEFVDANRSQQ